jgi:hypothetical protein
MGFLWDFGVFLWDFGGFLAFLARKLRFYSFRMISIRVRCIFPSQIITIFFFSYIADFFNNFIMNLL